MLLEFRTSNYKSFADEMVFSMTPAPKQKGLDYSVQLTPIGSKQYKSLSSAVIYGPNASGKTNIIAAMDTMKAIVLRGNIRNSDAFYSPNAASSALEMIPNSSAEKAPVTFAIRFIEKDILVDYSFSADLGKFMEKDYERRVLSEELSINEKPVFKRNGEVEVFIPQAVKPFLNARSASNAKLLEIARGSLNRDELFLNNGFKNIYAKDLVSLILDWFDNRFMVVVRSDAVRTMRKFADPKENPIYVEKTLTEASKVFGVNSNVLGYKPDGDDVSLWSVFDSGHAIPAEFFESYGTVRFVNEFPLVINALLNGGTLIMDEFDASIHPKALMNIINIFHNDDINKKKAQLIFNTHNPIFLDKNLFRRDEIKFVERDDKTNRSVHYALSDFRTADRNHKGENYMNNYFVNRYGAIKDVDFAPILEKIMEDEEKQNVLE